MAAASSWKAMLVAARRFVCGCRSISGHRGSWVRRAVGKRDCGAARTKRGGKIFNREIREIREKGFKRITRAGPACPPLQKNVRFLLALATTVYGCLGGRRTMAVNKQ